MEEKMYSYKYPHPAVATDCVIFGFDGMKLKSCSYSAALTHSKGNGRSLAVF